MATATISVVETDRRNCHPAAGETWVEQAIVLHSFRRTHGVIGSTIRNIAGEPHMPTALPRTGLAATRAEIHSRVDSRVRANRLAGKEAI